MAVQYDIDLEDSIEVAGDGGLGDVTRVEVDGDAVRFLGRKRSLLFATDARSLVVTWRPDAQSDDGDEPTVVHFARRDPLVLYGVDEARATTTGQGTAFLVLGDDERRPVAVVRANEVVSIRRGHLASERALRAIAACTQADGRLVVFGIESSVAGNEPNVISRTRELDGNWGGWEPVGQLHATDITAVLNTDGRMLVVACNDDDQATPNIWFATQDSPNDALNALSWHSMHGYLTSVSLTTTPDGALHLFGCNTHQPRHVFNVHWCDSASWANWHNAPHWLTNVEPVYQPDGTRVLVSLDTTGVQGVDGVYAYATSTTRPFGSSPAGQIYALRRPDGRIQCGGLSEHLDETIQSNVNGESEDWNHWGDPSRTRVGMSRIAATVGPDHSVHVVGLSAERTGAGELLVRTEQASGESWQPWRPVPAAD